MAIMLAVVVVLTVINTVLLLHISDKRNKW